MDTKFSTEGEVDFFYPTAGKPCKKWYKLYGSLASNHRVPLIVLHGGPGLGHNAMKPLAAFNRQYSIPVILYDEIGCGNSTHLPEKAGDRSFWTADLFVAELENLVTQLELKKYDVLGQSFGGMMASQFAAKKPPGLRRLVISNAPADMKLRYKASDELLLEMPEKMQTIARVATETGKFDTPEYGAVWGEFVRRYMCTVSPPPEVLLESVEVARKDNTVSTVMDGPDEFNCMGTLRDWSMIGKAKDIAARTLLINGNREIASDEAVAPFFREIEKVKWVKFLGSSHSPHLEEPERFIKVVGDFLIDE